MGETLSHTPDPHGTLPLPHNTPPLLQTLYPFPHKRLETPQSSVQISPQRAVGSDVNGLARRRWNSGGRDQAGRQAELLPYPSSGDTVFPEASWERKEKTPMQGAAAVLGYS